MKVDTIWQGVDEVNCGYAVTENDGCVTIYHMKNKKKFEQYLLDNARIEMNIQNDDKLKKVCDESFNLCIDKNWIIHI